MKSRLKTIIVFLTASSVIFVIGLYFIGFLNPLVSEVLCSQITRGMTLQEAEDTRTFIDLPLDMTCYIVNIPANAPDERWEDFKEAVKQIDEKNPDRFTFKKRHNKSKLESLLLTKRSSFEMILAAASKDKEKYKDLTAYIDVCLMGPVFLKNDFYIYIDLHGKVSAITRVLHWD